MALTRDQELKLAQNRVIAGETGTEDVKNLDYAKDYVTPIAGTHFNKADDGRTDFEKGTGISGYDAALAAQSAAGGGANGSNSAGANLTPTTTPYMGDTGYTAESYEDIRKRTADEMQNQIDAINANYASITAQENMYGTDRLGRTRSGSARGGLLGSSFGNMRQDKTENYNTQQLQAIEADRNTKLSGVYANLDKRADERYDKEVSRAKGAVDDYNTWLDKTKKSTREDLAIFAKNGGSIDDIEDYQEFAELAGFDYNEENGMSVMLDSWLNYNKPEEEKIKFTFKELKDGTLLRTGDDGSAESVGNFSPPDETAGWEVTDRFGTPQWVKMGDDNTIYEVGEKLFEEKKDFTLGKARYSFNEETGNYEIIAGTAGDGSPSTVSKEEKEYFDLAKNAARRISDKAGDGENVWGQEWNILYSRYQIPELGLTGKELENAKTHNKDLTNSLDSLLNKDAYYDVKPTPEGTSADLDKEVAGTTVADIKARLKDANKDYKKGWGDGIDEMSDEEARREYRKYLLTK